MMARQEFRNMPLDELTERFKMTGQKWIETRKEVIKTLREMVKGLCKINRDVRIAKTTGATASIVGGGLVIGGFVASFFTFGATAVVGLVGSAIAGSGGATAFGASIGDMVQKKKYEKKRNKLLKKDHQLADEFKELIEVLQKKYEQEFTKTKGKDFTSLKDFFTIATGTFATGGTVAGIANTAAKLAAGVGDDVAATVFRAASPAVRVFQIAGGLVSIIALPIDLYTLVKSAKALADKEGCELSEELAGLADELEENLHCWETCFRSEMSE